MGLCLELGPMCLRTAYIILIKYRRYCDLSGFIYLKQEYINKSRKIILGRRLAGFTGYYEHHPLLPAVRVAGIDTKSK